MKKIRKVGRTQPRDSVDFYKENPDLFVKLQKGETIEVPDDLFPKLKGVAITTEDIMNSTETSSKSRKRDRTSSKTTPDSYIEANRPDRQPSEDDIVIKHEDSIETEDEAVD